MERTWRHATILFVMLLGIILLGVLIVGVGLWVLDFMLDHPAPYRDPEALPILR